MSKKLFGAVLVAATLAAPAVLACDGARSEQSAQKSAVQKVTIPQVAQLQKEKKVTVLDANGEDFRKANGVIPGAVLLTNYAKYDVAKELPAAKDTQLVFYCANTQCGASQAAAQKAVDNGYTHVAFLPAGLLGWKQSGQPTASALPRS